MSWLIALKAFGDYSDQFAQGGWQSAPTPSSVYVTQTSSPHIVTRGPKSPITSDPVIETIIRSYAQKYSLDGDLMVAIAKAESGLVMKWNYMNPTGDPNSRWSAYGVFQELSSHEKTYGESRMTLEGNIDIAMRLMSDYLAGKIRTNPWILSQANWSP